MSTGTMQLQNEVQLMAKMTELEESAAYCCFAVHTLLASPCMFKALVSRKGYLVVVTSKTCAFTERGMEGTTLKGEI